MKSFSRSKLLELCKTRGKESSPDLFNFQVALAGHDKVKDAGNVTTCRRKFKDSSLQTKSTKNERPTENSVWSRKQFEDCRWKKEQEDKSWRLKKPSGKQGSQLNESIEQSLQKQPELKLNKIWKMHSNQNCWNFARLELRCQILTCSIFWSFGWSWHRHWRWQGYNAQWQVQSPFITNKMYKNRRTSRKYGFDQENSLKISEEKKNRNIIHYLWKNQVEHKGVNWLSPMKEAFISSKNYTKQNLKKAFRSNCWN